MSTRALLRLASHSGDKGAELLAKLRQHIPDNLNAFHTGDVAVVWPGRDMQHVAWAGYDLVPFELVAQVAGQHEDAVPGFAPVPCRAAGRTLLVSQRDAEGGHCFPHLQPRRGFLQGMVGGTE